MLSPLISPQLPVAAVLPTQRWHLGFPPAIEARYEADTGARRSRDLQLTGLVALAIYDLFLINDWLSRPEVLGLAVLWRLGVVTVYGLLVLALIRRGLPPRWREAAMASTTLVAMVGSCMIFRSTTSGTGIYDPFVFALIFLAGNIMFQLRFVAALLSSVAGLLVAAGFLFRPTALPDPAKPFAMGLLLATAVFTVVACFRLERAERHAYLLILREVTRSDVAVQAADTYAALSQTDALTQLANRRAFDLELPERWKEAARHGQSMAVLLIDIDHFKRFNDRFGHPAGDECLRRVAQLMREALREDDFIARIGGEEFAVLPRPDGRFPVAQLAERLRLRVERAGIPHDARDGQHVVSISLGLAVTGPAQPLQPAALIAAADSALYQAKHQGRNRCVMSEEGAATSRNVPARR
jgi:diguanylate cyclase (GGDEF)-like protein